MASKTTSIVLNLGSQRLAMANIVGASKGSLALTKYETFDLEGDPSSDATRIPQLQMGVQSLVNQLKAKGAAVRYAIPGQPVFLRFVKLPPLSQEKVAQIVEFEAQQNVPFPLDEVSWGYQLIGEPGSVDVEVLLGAVKSDELTSINAAVERSGLKPLSVDPSPALIYNAFRYNYPDQTEPALIVDIGARTTNLIYVEEGKVFISPSRIGGANFTHAIAKELEIPFEHAEKLKIEKGGVALGGGYESAEDPQTAALGNIIRSSLARMHGEIVRTNNRYRSQQGGQSPTVVYLAGRSSGLPGLAQFFQDKLGVPVQYFNALRNVAVGPKVDQNAVAADAHALGELIGLALRNVEGSPLELELVPESLASARDLEKRKPALVLATVALLSALAAGSVYYSRAAAVTEDKMTEELQRKEELQLVQDQIDKIKAELETYQAETTPFANATTDRSYWVRFFDDLNSRIPDNSIWFTTLEPIAEEKLFLPPIGDNLQGAFGSRYKLPDPTDAKASTAKRSKNTPVFIEIGGIQLKGLFRSPAPRTLVSERLIDELKKSPYFNLEGLELGDILIEAEDGQDDTLWAWGFTLHLRLRNPIPIAEIDTTRK